MRRLLILLFAVMLPLQFTWASAAAFCEHGREQQHQQETGFATAWHFGHHTHEHEAGRAHGKSGTKLPDADCAVCHFAGSQVMLPAETQPASYHFITVRYRVLPVHYASVTARVPYRPQWLPLA
jgi:hypothetical protein